MFQQRLEDDAAAEVKAVLSMLRGTFKSFQKECKKAFKKAEIDHINSEIQKGLDERNT